MSFLTRRYFDKLREKCRQEKVEEVMASRGQTGKDSSKLDK
jgi:hypothetical protein